MKVTDNVAMKLYYRPALYFATSAKGWRERAGPAAPAGPDGEAAMLVLFYSALALESLIAEAIDEHLNGITAHLLLNRVSVLERWSLGAQCLSKDDETSKKAVLDVCDRCNDKGMYGLLVRARNKLVHPRAHVEVLDMSGLSVQDNKLDTRASRARCSTSVTASVEPRYREP